MIQHTHCVQISKSRILFQLYQLSIIIGLMNVSSKQLKQKQSPPITQFKGYYQFLSIDYKANVYYEGFLYPSVATAFQAARTNDMNLRRRISEIEEQEQFKKIVTQIQSAPDWANRRLNVMTVLNRDKFKRNKDLGLKLFATQSRQLINGYQKGGDAELFWGMLQRNEQFLGLNTLGKILSNLREQMKNGLDNKNWVNELNLQKNADLWPEANLIVQKQGDKVDNLLLIKKNTFFLGSHQANNFRLQHGSISKFHASIYFSSDMQIVLIDLNSSHGTVIERKGQDIKLQPLRPQSLEDRDVLRFGMSTRRYTIYFSYEQVQRRIDLKQREAKQQLQRISKIKKLETQNFESEVKQRNAIKSLLELKEYACLYVQNVNRNFGYKDIKQVFNNYGPVKNVRINIDQKTGRFMGSVLVYYDQKVTQIRKVLQNISKDPIKYEFRIVAINSDEAEKIIASFTNKQREQQNKKHFQQLKQKKQTNRAPPRRKREGGKQSRSRSRSRRKSSSLSSSSSDKSSGSRWSKQQRVLKSYDK